VKFIIFLLNNEAETPAKTNIVLIMSN